MTARGLVASLALLIAGCSGTPPAVGTVRFDDGEPVRSGSVEFRDTDSGDRYASRIAPDGGFELTDAAGDPGLPPGDYEVVVVQIVLTEDLAAAAHEHGQTVPRHYADYYTTDLRVQRPESATDPIEVVLSPDP